MVPRMHPPMATTRCLRMKPPQLDFSQSARSPPSFSGASGADLSFFPTICALKTDNSHFLNQFLSFFFLSWGGFVVATIGRRNNKIQSLLECPSHLRNGPWGQKGWWFPAYCQNSARLNPPFLFERPLNFCCKHLISTGNQ